jgi:hypothetical protein
VSASAAPAKSVATALPARRRQPSGVAALQVALVVAVVVHLAVLLLARPVFSVSPKAEAGAGEMRRATVSAVPLPDDVRTRADIADSEPLYLHTPRNYGYDSSVSRPVRIEDELGGPPIAAPEPVLFARPGAPLPLDTSPSADRTAATATATTAAAASTAPSASRAALPEVWHLLPLQRWNVAATLGLRPLPAPVARPPSQPWMRVEDIATGAVVLAEGKPLEVEAALNLPPEVSGTSWHPVAFSVLVDSLGVVGLPVPLAWGGDAETGAKARVGAGTRVASGNETVDAAIQRHLTSGAGGAVLRQLPPGHYRVIVLP